MFTTTLSSESSPTKPTAERNTKPIKTITLDPPSDFSPPSLKLKPI